VRLRTSTRRVSPPGTEKGRDSVPRFGGAVKHTLPSTIKPSSTVVEEVRQSFTVQLDNCRSMSVDMDMDMGHTSADYSDYEYQHFEVLHRDVSGTEENRTTIKFGVEPLETSSGLDVNEVAELVAIRWQAFLGSDGENENNQSSPGTAQFRGIVGANIDSLQDMISPSGGGSNELDQTPQVLGFENSEPSATLFGHDRSEVFDHFSCDHGIPFADPANGAGGGAAYAPDRNMIHFRELSGRGPVLDANDEIAVISNLNKDGIVADLEATFRATLVWDTATVDDAGAKFSVPQ